MDTLGILRTLAASIHGLALDEALRIADAIMRDHGNERPNLSTLEGRVAFARSLPEVVNALDAGKKIQAIKALREASMEHGPTMSLVESKHAVDAIDPNWPPRDF